ncbi:MAG: adenine-specific methyltransferase EcoRI family protein [Prevotella sp.]|nr:adenine-specific methyltransferase EcoRI family protein [Prevotella sp.]
MSGNRNLRNAMMAKNDEFYTRHDDIQKEVNAYLDYDPDTFRDKIVFLPCDDPEWSNFTKFFVENFEFLGLKKLISTSYAYECKNVQFLWEPTDFEKNSIQYKPDLSKSHGKKFVLDRDAIKNKTIDITNLEWNYLHGTGDFRSPEITALRDEADIIVTNPPFSLLREFIRWVFEGQKNFLIIGNTNTVTCKDVFPLICNNELWLGVTNYNTGMYFYVPDDFQYASTYKFLKEIDGKAVNRVAACCWYTNLEHGRRHEPLTLMTERNNIKYSKHKDVKGIGYHKYVNYDAIDIPSYDAIPSDYNGIMAVPITYLDKYCPEQFEIVGNASDGDWLRSLGVKPMGTHTIKRLRAQGNKSHVTANMVTLYLDIDGIIKLPYSRILIRKKQ